MSFFKDSKNQILSYDECKNIYRTATLGKRIVEGLVNFAMSAEREIDIHKAPPEAIEKFKETADEMKQDEAIKKTIYNSRIYGTGALYVAMYDEEKEEDDFTTKPTFEDAHKYKMKFTVMDPLNISGSRVDLDPLSFHFLEVIDIQVNSKQITKKRIAVSHALEPLYLDSRTSLIPFSPPSVFYNMVALLNQYDDAIKSIGDLLYKAGAIIYKYPAKSKLNGVTIDAVTASKQILEQKRSGEVISISSDSTIEDFPISNLNGLIDSINKLEDDITKALNDTPASILFDKSLSNGFSEGDKDKETEISIIESFRENKLTPLYNLTDYYVMLKAWDSAFIDDMRYKYSEYQDKTDSEIFRSWAENFKFKYGNLFPEPESVTQDNNAKKLDNLLKAQQLGANPADLQEELNESEIFKNEMELDPQGMGGMEGEEESDNDLFDYTQNDSSIKADCDNNFEKKHPRKANGEFKEKGSGEDKKSKKKSSEVQKIINDFEERINKIIDNLPEELKEIGKRVYNYDAEAGEYILTDGKVDEEKLKKLSTLEQNFYHYTERNTKLTKDDLEKLNILMYNAPSYNTVLYRSVNGNKYLNSKIGDEIDLSARGFTDTESVADFYKNIARTRDKTNITATLIIDSEHRDISLKPYSNLRDDEEHLIHGKYIIEDIKEETDNNYKHLTIKIKEVKDNG